MDTTTKKALDLIEYIKEYGGVDLSQKNGDIYKDIAYALSDSEYLRTIPEDFQDQKIVEDAWSICYARTCSYVTKESCADLLPSYLSEADVTVYELYCDINHLIDKRITSVISMSDAEKVSSDAIEEAIESLTLENGNGL